MQRLCCILVALSLAFSVMAQRGQTAHRKLNLELLVFDGCPNSPKMRANVVAALKKLGLPQQISTVDLGKLPKIDPRLGFGAPTVLVNGVDLFGLKPTRSSEALSCRLYGGGVPSVTAIAARLRSY